MKKLLYISGSSVLLLLALLVGAFFASPVIASASSAATTPTTTTTKAATHKKLASPLKGFVRKYSDQVVDQIAPQLHLSDAQLTQKLKSGEGLLKIAKGQKVSAANLKTILVKSVDTVVAQELKAGKITQKHATLLTTRVKEHPFVVARVLHNHYYKK